MLSTHIAPVFLYDADRASGALEAFQSDAQRRNGIRTKVLGIFEVSEQGSPAEKFLSSFITVLDRAHTAADMTETDLETRFEYIVKQANEKISLDLPPTRVVPGARPMVFSGLLMYLEKDAIAFAGVGAMRGLLLTPSKKEEGGWHMTDIVEPSRTKSPLFAQVFSGPLREYSTMIFCTSSLCDVLSFEYLKKTIGKYEPSVAAERLEHFLSQLSGHLPFAAFVIGVKPEEEPQEMPLLNPEAPLRRATIGPGLAQQFAPFIRALIRGLNTIAWYAKKAGKAFAILGQNSIRHAKGPVSRALRGLVTVLRSPRVSVPILGILVVGSSIWFGISTIRLSQEKTYTELAVKIAEIEDSQHQAESFLSLGNEMDAKNKLQRMALLLQALPATLPADLEEKRTTMVQAMTQQTQQLQHMVTPTTPIITPIAEIGLKGSSWVIPTKTNFLLVAAQHIAVLPRKTTTTKEPSATTFNIPQEEGTITRVVVTDHNSLILVTSKKIFKEFDIKKSSFTTLSVPIKNIQSITGVALYNKKLYILDADTAQIWKLLPVTQGFGEAKEWLNVPSKDTILKGANLLAIDGSVFTSTPQGKLQKFDAGKLSSFTAHIDPTPSAISRFTTSPSSKYLYLVDHQSQRLVVLAKDSGIPVTQYTSPIWKGLRDAHIDEKTKTITLLTNVGIVEFEASHLVSAP